MEKERAMSFEYGSSMPNKQPHGREGWKLQRERVRNPRTSGKHIQVLKRRIEKKQTLKKSKMTLRARSNQLTAAKLFSGHDENMAHMKSQQGQLSAQGQASQNSRMDWGGIRKSHPWLNSCRQLTAASRG